MSFFQAKSFYQIAKNECVHSPMRMKNSKALSILMFMFNQFSGTLFFYFFYFYLYLMLKWSLVFFYIFIFPINLYDKNKLNLILIKIVSQNAHQKTFRFQQIWWKIMIFILFYYNRGLGWKWQWWLCVILHFIIFDFFFVVKWFIEIYSLFKTQ